MTKLGLGGMESTLTLRLYEVLQLQATKATLAEFIRRTLVNTTRRTTEAAEAGLAVGQEPRQGS